MPDIGLRVKTPSDFLFGEMLTNERILFNQGLKVSLAFPGTHRMPLHGLIGLFSDRALFDEGQEQPLGVDQATGLVQGLEHAVRIDDQFREDFVETNEHVIRENRTVRENDSFDRGVTNVPFMPQGDIFQRG